MRRNELIERMEELEASGLSCSGCQGKCCTYEANSMMITPLETLELQHYLKHQGALTPELKAKFQETVLRFRLDHPGGDGRRSFIRRTYTCPLFNHQELGCPLPREVKPYGCLAFNAHNSQSKAGEHCYSEKELLMKRENDYAWEAQLNETLRKKFGIIWEKAALPLALLEVWDLNIEESDIHSMSAISD